MWPETRLLNAAVLFQPFYYQCGVIVEDQFAWFQIDLLAHSRKRLAELSITLNDFGAAWNDKSSMGTEPVTHYGYRGCGIIVMCRWILACNIRTKLLISIGFFVEYQTDFLFLPPISECLGTEKYSQFKGHIEPWQTGLAIWFGPRNVMNTELALLDKLDNLVNADLTCVANFLCAPRHKATIVDREHKRVEERAVLCIKRTIDKDTLVIPRSWHRIFSERIFAR
jgi:hypothetical protein